MDRIKSAADIIKGINIIRNREDNDYASLIPRVCAFFDLIKSESLSNADLKFLRFISTEIGIPHYFGMLNKFQNQDIDNQIDDIDLKTFNTLVSESVLHTDDYIMIHRYQQQILALYQEGQLNRYFLSASTSFGKTFLVYEIIRKMNYNNIVLIFPTIALLSENLGKIYSDVSYQWIKNTYDIHTLSDVEITRDKNIFIYTPERYLSFIEKSPLINLDFVFIDEVYKIDNEYIIDEKSQENERDVAYRLAVFFALAQDHTDGLLAGPYIEFSTSEQNNYNPSFDRFLQHYRFSVLNYNSIEIVNKSSVDIKTKREYRLDEDLQLSFDTTSKPERFKSIINTLTSKDENIIVYCHSRNETEKYAKYIIEDSDFASVDLSSCHSFISHLETAFSRNTGRDWVVVKALKKGIGIHHGLIPKYVQKEIIRLFNEGVLKVLLSTTTITEGVNTSSKNMLILSEHKGSKLLKKFDAKNIEGRAGRFLQHYSGRVIILQNRFLDIVNSNTTDYIKHRNYDIDSPKQEIDLYYTPEIYLKNEDKARKHVIDSMQAEYGIPDYIISNYKVVSKEDKITIYKHITLLSESEEKSIEELIRVYNYNGHVTTEGLETIIRVTLPIVKNKTLRFFMTNGRIERNNCYLSGMIISYLKGGLKGSIEYHLGVGRTIDEAMHKATDFIYNILKYQVVKYFGAFNLMYKYWKSTKKHTPFDQTIGIDKLLLRFEYNSTSKLGRLASDFGVPQKVVDYYDGISNISLQSFDEYERQEYQKINPIINN